MYIDYAEMQAARGKAMTMKDWVGKLNAFLKFSEYEILTNFAGNNDKFRWSRWRVKTGKELFKYVRDEVFPFVEELQNSHKNIGQIFHGAKLIIPDAAVLKRGRKKT